jgi:hypothetical protein
MINKPLRWVLLGALIGLVGWAVFVFVLPRPESTGLEPGKDVPFYSMPWNDNPFYPGEITTTDGRIVRGDRIPTAEFCAQCHAKEYREWVVSIHAVSGPDVLYDLTIEANEKAHRNRLGTEKIRWCESCHEPVSLLTGQTNPLAVVGPSPAAREGTTCVVCHTAVKAEPLVGNAALTLALNELQDYWDPALILAAPEQHAKAMQAKAHNPLMGHAALCGACHTEIRPAAVAGYEEMHLQDTYDEWRRSVYASMGVHCQDCHMSPNPAEYVAELKRTGRKPERRGLSHRFVGINYVLTSADLPNNLIVFLRGGYPPGDISTEEWKAELLTQRELILALLREAADLRIEAPEPAVPGKPWRWDVIVTNSGAGHDLPTGPRDQRFMWLEVKVTDAAGRTLYHSGWFDPKTGEIDPDAVIYLKILRDKAGNVIKRHILFDAHTIEYTRKPIPPKGQDRVPYLVELPSDVQGPLTVHVTLWYQLALQELVKYNVRLDLVIPLVKMAEATLEVPVE